MTVTSHPDANFLLIHCNSVNIKMNSEEIYGEKKMRVSSESIHFVRLLDISGVCASTSSMLMSTSVSDLEGGKGAHPSPPFSSKIYHLM
jgi:hypothetical protein